jgi:PAS domain S-box-containing protein
MKILVVDDNIENINMMMIVLKSKNYKVTAAGNGQEALKKLRSKKFDLIISDILMPVMDGFQLCRECKKDVDLSKICFIFYTATYIDNKDEEFALSLGAQRFIRKPQEPEVFLNLINEVIEKSGNGKNAPIVYTEQDEKEVLKLYSERLVTKLEKKNLDLENEIASHEITVSELKESEEKYKTLFTVAQEAIFIADAENGILLDCNEAACTLVERQKEELIGKHQSILHPPDELVDEFTESFRKHIMSEPKLVLAARIVTKSGTTKDVEIKAKVLNIGGKKIIQGFFNDVTKRKRAEEALFKEQHLLNSLIETIPDSIYFKDNESCFIRINKMMAKKFGLNDSQEALCKTDYDFFDEEHAHQAFEDEQRIIATGEPVVGLEEKEVWLDGHITWVSTTKMPLRDKTGKIIGIMGISRDITERKLAKETILIEQTLLKTLIDNLPSAVFVKDKNYRKTVANVLHISSMASHLKNLGMNPEIDFIGKTDFEVCPKELAEKYFADDQKVIRDGKSIINKEEEGYSPEGKPIWLLISKIPIRDINGEINGMIGITTDITERKLAEETIIEERTLLRTLIDNLPVGVFVKDKEYRKIIVNPVHVKEVMGHLKYLGVNSEIDILGKTDFEVFPKELAKNFFVEDQKVVRDGSLILNNEGLGFSDEGNQLWLLVSKIPLRDKNSEIIGMVGVTTDITKHRQAEEALKTSEEEFRTIFDNASDGMFVLDMEARKFMMCNAACSKMLGYSGDEFINLDIAAIHPSEELPFIFEQIEKIFRGEEGVRSDIKFKRKDGTIFTADLGPTLVTIAEKRLLLIVFRDITEHLLIETELRSAKEKAEESDKLKTSFLANISHEVRTPMNGIMGFIDLLKTPNLKSTDQIRYLDIIAKCSSQLLDIITNIVEISKVESNQIIVNKTPVNFSSILNTIYTTFSHNLSADKNVIIKLNIHSSVEECICITDEMKLIQILTSLVDNAIKYTPDGTVEIGCQLFNSNELEFFVKDTGIGIPKESYELIFERFRQVESTLSREYGGMGLGLSITKAYVELLGGRIWLDSEPGKGSTFHFTLPCIPMIKEDRSAEVSLKPENDDLSGKVILIAEDDDNNYAYLEEILLDKKVKIIRANNGKEAVEICKTNPEIELVLMDIKMPVLNGYEATNQILKFRKNLPIVAQTAYAFLDDRQEAMDCGCIDYISKPINNDQLMAILNKHLKKLSI